MNLSSLPMSRKQLRSIAQSARHRIAIWSGAIRSGKTIASLVAFLIALSVAPSTGLVIIAGRSLQTIERNLIEPLQDPAIFGALSLQVVHTRGSTTAVILGRTVHLIGASDARAEGRLRGASVCLAVADEITLLPEAFFKQLLGRLSVPGARLLGTTNPDSSAHWLKRDFIDRALELGIGHWHFTLDDNPSLTLEYTESIKAEYGEGTLFFKRFIEGKWIAAEGAVFDMWDDERHVVDALPRMHRWLSVGVDYGTSNPFHATLLGLGTDRRLYVASEWRYDGRHQRRQLTDAEYSERMRGWLGDVPGIGPVRPQFVTVDPSAASFSAQLRRDKLTPTPAKNDVLDGIRTMASLLASGRLLVHASCRALIGEMPGYAWDDKAAEKGEDRPIKVADHGIDSARYALFTTRALWQRQLALAA
ncbi:Terminase-like family protein [Streptomyces sp. ADI96-02]|uniref:PBSX family phage terminase large subunit n=1 Tax=Streptomyces sp. ADI96-02 TaxID=1522760 RepID=UPI000F99A266|nr:PBSX family phage terminase large subunit [Streptomyces sp. ADI96-02]RPK56219.1 Terminase-like family protein [Streptomyces sp. ADI96-02]